MAADSFEEFKYILALKSALIQKHDEASKLINYPEITVNNYFNLLRSEIDAKAEAFARDASVRLDGLAHAGDVVKSIVNRFQPPMCAYVAEREFECLDFVQMNSLAGEQRELAALKLRMDDAFRAWSSSASTCQIEEDFERLYVAFERFAKAVKQRLFLNRTYAFEPLGESEMGLLVEFRNECLTRDELRLFRNGESDSGNEVSVQVNNRDDKIYAFSMTTPRRLTRRGLVANKLACHADPLHSAFTYCGWVCEVEARANTSDDVFAVSIDALRLPDEKRLGMVFSEAAIEEIDAQAFEACSDCLMLRLDGNRLRSLPSGLFKQMAALKDLSITTNRLTSLARGCFTGLKNLTCLDLGHNFLGVDALDEKVFDGLGQLKVLRLEFNRFAKMDKALTVRLAPLVKLQTLNLSHNQIETAPSRPKVKFRGVKNLDLGLNKLMPREPQPFEALKELTSLNLEGNLIGSFKWTGLAGLEKLSQLNLGRNELESLRGEDEESRRQPLLIGSVASLDVSCNRIRLVERAAFRKFPNLVSLDMSENPIESLESGLFASLGRLESLVLRNCGLKTQQLDAALRGLSGLRRLDLSGNQLGSLAGDAFKEMPHLDRLELASNGLSSVGLAFNPELVELGLDDNQLRSLDDLKLNSRTRLKRLSLRRNQLRGVVKLSWLFAELERLDMSENAIEDFVSQDEHLIERIDLRGNKLGPKATKYALTGLQFRQLAISAENDELEDCYVDPDRPYAVLRDLNLLLRPELFDQRFASIVSLDLSRNNLTYFPPRTLRSLVLLERLSLSHNLIKFLETSALAGADRLVRLDLSHNIVSTLDAGVFASSLSLTELCLDQNPVLEVVNLDEQTPPGRSKIRLHLGPIDERLIEQLFQPASLFQLVNIKSSEVASLKAGWWEHLAAVCVLDLSHCSDQSGLAKALDEDANFLRPFARLTTLKLAGNRLRSINRFLFRNMTSLESLDLSDNSLTALDAGLFRGTSRLRTLVLSRNEFRQLDLARLLSFTRRLERLELAFNQLDDGSVNKSTLTCASNESLACLRHLDLRGNKLTNWDFVAGLYRLERLETDAVLDWTRLAKKLSYFKPPRSLL